MIDRGILIGSGMIAGEGLVGVGIAFYALLAEHKPEGIGVGWAGDFATPLAIILFLGLASILVRRYREDRNAPPSPTVH